MRTRVRDTVFEVDVYSSVLTKSLYIAREHIVQVFARPESLDARRVTGHSFYQNPSYPAGKTPYLTLRKINPSFEEYNS